MHRHLWVTVHRTIQRMEESMSRELFIVIVRGNEPYPHEEDADAVLTIMDDGLYRVIRNRYGPAGETCSMDPVTFRTWTTTMQRRKDEADVKCKICPELIRSQCRGGHQ